MFATRSLQSWLKYILGRYFAVLLVVNTYKGKTGNPGSEFLSAYFSAHLRNA